VTPVTPVTLTPVTPITLAPVTPITLRRDLSYVAFRLFSVALIIIIVAIK
jgi:hypothetical protein